jgi:hypothetical protein
MLFIVDNQKDFLTNACVHSLDTRNKNHLSISVVSLSCVQKGVSYLGIKIFNSIPSSIESNRNKRKRFKNKLYKHFIIYLSGLVTAVAVFWNSNTIPFCLTTDLLLNVLFSWLAWCLAF